MPKVSVVVPIYNVEQYLQECLDSLINQTLRDIEIICVNDGSTDSCACILEEYKQRDDRIKVISKSNSGYGHTMNVGLDAAKGEYIGIVEPDDYVVPEMYKTLYDLAVNNEVDFVKADFYRFTGEKDKIQLQYNDLSYGKKHYYNKLLNPAENIEIFKFIMNTWSGIYRRDFIERYHIRHNETPGASFQDNGFFFQTFCRASRVYFLDRPFYMNRRDNPNSSVKSKEKVFCIRDEYDYIKNFLRENPPLYRKFIYIYSYKKYSNYWATYKRVADEFKPMFLDHFRDEFKKIQNNGELDLSLFSKIELERLNDIISDSNSSLQEPNWTFNFVIRHMRKNGIGSTLKSIKNKITNN